MALITWDTDYEAEPAGATEAVAILDNEIHELKENVRLRLEAGGHLVVGTSTQADLSGSAANAWDGRHMVEASADDGPSPDIYKTDGETKLVEYTNTLMKCNEDIEGGNVSSGNNPGHAHDVTITIPLNTVGTGRIQDILLHNDGNGAVTLLEAYLTAYTAPGSSGFVLDMHLLPDTYTDPSLVGTSIWSSLPTLADGENKAGPFSSLSDAELAVGEAWAFEIDTNDGADDVVLHLKVRRA